MTEVTEKNLLREQYHNFREGRNPNATTGCKR